MVCYHFVGTNSFMHGQFLLWVWTLSGCVLLILLCLSWIYLDSFLFSITYYQITAERVLLWLLKCCTDNWVQSILARRWIVEINIKRIMWYWLHHCCEALQKCQDGQHDTIKYWLFYVVVLVDSFTISIIFCVGLYYKKN